MDSTKPWYLSRTLWASFVTVATSVAGLFGLSLAGVDNSTLTDTLLQVITAGSGVAAIIGRLGAVHKLR
jgi:hypothetical protein